MKLFYKYLITIFTKVELTWAFMKLFYEQFMIIFTKVEL
jgi:hypothetical protein